MPTRGMAMLEAAIGLVMLAIGLTGLLWWQQRHMVQQRQHQARAQVLHLASDLVERIRLNPQALAAYALSWPSEVPAAPDCRQQACTRDDLAKWDVQQWWTRVHTELPEGRASVFPATDALGWWGVVLAWNDPDAHLRTDTSHGTPACPEAMSCWRLWFHPG
jgi:type IV pilus modification protein PilV